MTFNNGMLVQVPKCDGLHTNGHRRTQIHCTFRWNRMHSYADQDKLIYQRKCRSLPPNDVQRVIVPKRDCFHTNLSLHDALPISFSCNPVSSDAGQTSVVSKICSLLPNDI